jgi:arylsulfatase A-like enzyme
MHQRGPVPGARRSTAAALALAGIVLSWSAASCSSVPRDGRPSVVLLVVDTLRADAVSAYGRVNGTTSNLDRLAAEGLVYAHAYAPAPWTLPSHASLLTGLRADQHGIGIHGAFRLPDDLSTLAEKLHEAGYETIGFSENSIVDSDFGMDQGFDSLQTMSPEDLAREIEKPGSSAFSIVDLVGAWAKQRKRDRPFFLFLNVMDAHEPYFVRERNFFLPAELAGRAASVDQSPRVCTGGLSAQDIDVLRGLYLGDVAAADAKAAGLLAALAAAGYGEDVVTIVTSDHGQHLGEHGIVNHQFSVREQLLRVPLIVHGLKSPHASIEEPVDLIDVMPSILAWTGAGAVAGLPGRTLPVAGASSAPPVGDVVVLFGDWIGSFSKDMRPWIVKGAAETASARERTCAPEHRVRGDMVAFVRWPHKLIRYQSFPPELYDVHADPEEQTDLSKTDSATLAALQAALDALGTQSDLLRFPAAQPSALDPNARKALESLGYVE